MHLQSPSEILQPSALVGRSLVPRSGYLLSLTFLWSHHSHGFQWVHTPFGLTLLLVSRSFYTTTSAKKVRLSNTHNRSAYNSKFLYHVPISLMYPPNDLCVFITTTEPSIYSGINIFPCWIIALYVSIFTFNLECFDLSRLISNALIFQSNGS